MSTDIEIDEDRRITCFVADDQPAVVYGVSAALAENAIDVVGRTDNGAEALAAIEARRPTVAVVALRMPRLDGIEIARRAMPGTAVIVYAEQALRERVADALAAGARGFVLKETPLDELVRAVRFAARGEVYVDPGLSATLVGGRVGSTRAALSTREREILQLLSSGKSNADIAALLFVSVDTVRTYLRRAMQKLEADTRTQAVAIAIRESLIP